MNDDLSEESVLDRIKVHKKDESHRPTVQIDGRPLSDGFTVEKIGLRVLSGDDAGDVVLFENAFIRIGSDPLNDIVLTDPTVSRHHAEIRRVGDDIQLVDMNSTNGTTVDGLSVAEINLQPNQIFQVGRTQIRVSTLKEQIPISVTQKTHYGSMVGHSVALREIFSILDRIAPSELSIVIEGETGTGKELIARAIHDQSNRAKKPFVVFDCSAFTATLLESELFGHEKGAFSGALAKHRGVFERANGGTIFFDELGEMDIEFQPKFLRVLETGDLRRVGGESTFNVDVRVVAATNRDLEELIAEKKFRQDLFYRLAKVRFLLPPLRKRIEDIPPLTEHFLKKICKDRIAPTIDKDAYLILQKYEWPGNIRQLKNVIEKAIAFNDGNISADYFRKELSIEKGAPQFSSKSSFDEEVIAFQENEELLPFREAKEILVNAFEKGYLRRLLKENKNNVSAAARHAKIDRRHLYRLLKKHDIPSK